MGSKILIRIALCVVMLGVSAAGAWYLFLGKTLKHDAELQVETEKRQRALADLERSTAGIDDITHKIKDLQDAIAFFESKLPQEKEVETVLEQVWKMAEANSLQARTIKSGKTERTANYSLQSIDMNLSGDFNGFYLFLQQLEKMPRLTRVSDMSLNKVNEREGEMQAKVTLNIYFEPAGGSMATAGAN